MPDREKVINHFEDALSRIKPVDWWVFVRKDFLSDALALLKEQQRIIEQYQKADGFLFAHGWKWENYIDTQEEAHPIEVGEDGLPY